MAAGRYSQKPDGGGKQDSPVPVPLAALGRGKEWQGSRMGCGRWAFCDGETTGSLTSGAVS